MVRLAVALSMYWLMSGQLTEGRAWAERTLVVTGKAPAAQRAAALWEAGWFGRCQGDLDYAETLFRESLTLYQGQGDDLGTGRALNALGLVAEDRGDNGGALALHQEAARLLVPVKSRLWTGLSLHHLVRAFCLNGDLIQAERCAEQGLALARSEGQKYLPALILTDLADAAVMRGDFGRAAALWQERVGLTWDRWGLHWCLAELARIALRCGQHSRAARLLGAAETTWERLGITLVPAMAMQHDQDIAESKRALGEAFTAAWTEGRHMSPAEARAEAVLVAHEASTSIAAATAPAVPPYGLTPRELDVLRLLVEGRSDKEIGAALFLSHRTVMRHVTGILTKLGVENRTAATRYAVRHGLV